MASAPENNLARARTTTLIAGGGGLALVAALFFFDPTACLRGYLVGYLFVLALPVGSLSILMIQYLTGGEWGVLSRRSLEAATRTLPFVAVATLPLVFFPAAVYPWAGGYPPTAPGADAKAVYFDETFFLARLLAYFLVWGLLGLLLNRWSAAQDRDGDAKWDRRLGALSAPGLVLMGLTVSFAAIDLVMSLEPDWSSSIFGAMVGIGQVLTAFAFTVGALTWLAGRGLLPAGALTPARGQALGNLLLAFVMLWAYLTLSQFLLIWSANLPEEVLWYQHRLTDGWAWVAAALAVLQFFLPFFLLLSRQNKRDPRRLFQVAGLILAVRFLDLLWLVVPSYDDAGPLVILAALVAWTGLVGLWLANFLWELERRPLLPLHAPTPLEAHAHA